MNLLLIETDVLHTVHANAFNSRAFRKLVSVTILVTDGSPHIQHGAFDGLDFFGSTQLVAKYLHLPIGFFDRYAATMLNIHCNGWPDDIGLNDMFANEAFRVLHTLSITNVRGSQSKFQRLAAVNFTMIRRLNYLILVNCGIEIIELNAFDVVGRALRLLRLNSNRIKSIDIDMFRILFESKRRSALEIDENAVKFPCTCHLLALDAMQCPFVEGPRVKCIDCVPSEAFEVTACGLYRAAPFQKFCIDTEPDDFVRIFIVRMAYVRASLSIWTNFSSRARILLADFSALKNQKCQEMSFQGSVKCVKVQKPYSFTLNFNEFGEFRGAALLSITIIPHLDHFGARPMHSMTVRQENMAAIDWMAAIGIASSAFIGFCSGVCISLVRGYCKLRHASDHTTQATDRRSSYEYAMPMGKIDERGECNNYDEILVGPERNTYAEINESSAEQSLENYIEIHDTGYLAIQ